MMMLTFFLLSWTYLMLDVVAILLVPAVSLFMSMNSLSGCYDGVMFMDFTSVMMTIVTIVVIFSSVLFLPWNKMLMLMFWIMGILSVSSFLVSNYMLFYFLFEFIFIIMFFFIIGWGKSPERSEASFYMFFYTLIMSFPFLLMVLQCFYKKTSIFMILPLFDFNSYIWIFMLLVFVVKLPLFGFHLWLPKAHVEAPLAGSMVLAGVLLKLGGYGIIRFMPLMKKISFCNSLFFTTMLFFAMWGGMLISILCVRVMDLKMIIAYSSVVHMSVMMLGLMTMTLWGQIGAVLMMAAHGFISPILFMLMTEIYSTMNSRSLMMLKSMMNISPIFCMLWFISSCLNMGIPPFMSFMSELMIASTMSFTSIIEWMVILSIFFFTGMYCMLMYTSTHYGKSIFSNLYSLTNKTLLTTLFMLYFSLIYPVFFFYA